MNGSAVDTSSFTEFLYRHVRALACARKFEAVKTAQNTVRGRLFAVVF